MDVQHQQQQQQDQQTESTVENELENIQSSKLLARFEIYGWKPDPDLSLDENYMDMVMLVTRNSKCNQGSMACVLVKPKMEYLQGSLDEFYRSIISVATNCPLYSENDSDIHAEIAALGYAARNGHTTEGSTAYITMPPCKRCFAALLVAGTTRIVCRRAIPKQIADVALKHGIELVSLQGIDEQYARINSIIHGDFNGKRSKDELEAVQERRKRRKEEKQKRKESKRSMLS